MKKVLYTTLAGVALLGAGAATVTAVSAYENISQGVANVGKVGSKEYAAAVSELQILEGYFEKAGQNKISFELALENAQANLAQAQVAYQQAIDAAQANLANVEAARQAELAAASAGIDPDGKPVTFTGDELAQRIAPIEAKYNGLLAAAEAAVKAAQENTGAVEAAQQAVATEQNNVANATAAYNDARAAYEAQYSKVEALYNAFLANDPEGAKKAGLPAKVDGDASANNENAGKPAPKAQKAANTAKGEKVLPETAAVK